MPPFCKSHPKASHPQVRCLSGLFSILPGERPVYLQELLTGGDLGCLEALRQEGLFPYLYMLFLQQDAQIAPHPTLLAELKNAYLISLQQAARHEGEAARILGDLAASGVEVILLKGADLRLRVYGDPAARPMIDLDLLTHPHAIDRARTVLEGLGYQVIASHTNQRPGFREQFAPADVYEPPPGLTLKVDLHWGLWNESSVYDLPLSSILAEVRKASFQGVPVKVMAPEHLLMHLCLHAYWDGIMLRQLVDIILTASLLPVAWPRLQANASRWHCAPPLYQVLSLAHEVSPTAVPASALAGLAGRRTFLMEKLVKTNALGPLTYYLASLARQPLNQWPSFLAAKFWPDREYLVAKFGSPSRLSYIRQFLQKFH